MPSDSEEDEANRVVSMKGVGLTIAKGFCMGTADVVPGVSGGTMALVLGIYQRLLRAIRSVDLTLLQHLLKGQLVAGFWRADASFLLPLGIGIAGALLFFTRVVSLPQLIHTEPVIVYSIFLGLIVGSVVVLIRPLRPVAMAELGFLVAGIGTGLLIVNLVPVETPESAWFIFLAGSIAICAMILPGISGSFVLLLLKKYAYVFDAIGRFDFSVIVPFGCGAVVGIMAFSRFLVWLLWAHYRPTMLAIVGLLLASLWVIWPFQDRVYGMVRGKERLLSTTPLWPELDATTGLALGLTCAGCIVVFMLERLSRRNN